MANVTPGFNCAVDRGSDFSLSYGVIHHRFIAIDLAFVALLIRPDLRKEARPVKVQIGIEMRLTKGIDERGPALGNVGMAKEFSHHRPILAFDQSIVIRLPGS